MDQKNAPARRPPSPEGRSKAGCAPSERDSSGVISDSRKEYLPRLLYPGTYGNYCGPTPEFPGGWHGDTPVDAVDAACQAHDAAYEICKVGLRDRRGSRATPATLSVLTALRSTGLSAPVLAFVGSDEEYLSCVHIADQGLIRDGLRIRAASQRLSCPGDGFTYPRWFCQLQSLTLARIERVDFDLFLADLDWDETRTLVGGHSEPELPALKALEARRRRVINSGGVPLSKLIESVSDIEAEMNARL
eukprot:CAMPEP_0183333840 /NCGR_PEP_ID=MMETSP0164_2-20130417/2623_1 /TAXON_ID=221442 /ORGANISM="Coccolithus pelagicus ssp braarudi, Strain PLY182g" /LENGTH=246 /DNA_ID=CAMNT_0025502857 /DNA_START=1 /DNA_END=742 /DNA_ORIENTATION=+